MMQLKINQLKPKLKAPIILLVLIALIVGGWIYQKRVYQKYDIPAHFAKMPVSTQNMNDWKSYHNEKYGFEIKYPRNYYLDPKSNYDYISLRQNTTSAEECKKLGMRIGLRVYRLEQGNIHLGGNVIQFNKDLNMDDIARQFLAGDNRPLVRRECYKRDINGNNILICILNAPGEDPLLTGGIYEVEVFGFYQLKNGDRVLINVNNEDGGTPHTVDRMLRRDLLRILFTIRWSEA